jgi:hypothetical protein
MFSFCWMPVRVPHIHWLGSWVDLANSLDVVAKRNVSVHVRNWKLVILPIFSHFTDWTILTQQRKIWEFNTILTNWTQLKFLSA